MYEIVEMVASAIDSEILGVRRIDGPVAAGTDTLDLADVPEFCTFTRGYVVGDEIAVYDPGANDVVERSVVIDLDATTLYLSDKLTTSFNVANVQHSYGGQFVWETYRGDPGNIARYPSIVVSYQGIPHGQQPLTIADVREDHICDIEIYVSGTARETARRFLYTLTDRVQRGFARAIYPATWETYGPDWAVFDPKVIGSAFNDRPTGDALLMSSVVTVSLGVQRQRIKPTLQW